MEAILGPSGPSKSLKNTMFCFQCFLYFGCFPSKSHFEPLWGPSWGPLGAPFSLKQGRLGAPRRSGAPTDYFFSALGGPKRPQRAPQKLSWTPRGPPRGPRGPRTPLEQPLRGPNVTKFGPKMPIPREPGDSVFFLVKPIMHTFASSARAGFREATGIRRPPFRVKAAC